MVCTFSSGANCSYSSQHHRADCFLVSLDARRWRGNRRYCRLLNHIHHRFPWFEFWTFFVCFWMNGTGSYARLYCFIFMFLFICYFGFLILLTIGRSVGRTVVDFELVGFDSVGNTKWRKVNTLRYTSLFIIPMNKLWTSIFCCFCYFYMIFHNRQAADQTTSTPLHSRTLINGVSATASEWAINTAVDNQQQQQQQQRRRRQQPYQ